MKILELILLTYIDETFDLHLDLFMQMDDEKKQLLKTVLFLLSFVLRKLIIRFVQHTLRNSFITILKISEITRNHVL